MYWASRPRVTKTTAEERKIRIELEGKDDDITDMSGEREREKINQCLMTLKHQRLIKFVSEEFADQRWSSTPPIEEEKHKHMAILGS